MAIYFSIWEIFYRSLYKRRDRIFNEEYSIGRGVREGELSGGRVFYMLRRMR
jgi:hypothetical protein